MAAKKEAGGDEKHLIFFTWPYYNCDQLMRSFTDSVKSVTVKCTTKLATDKMLHFINSFQLLISFVTELSR